MISRIIKIFILSLILMHSGFGQSPYDRIVPDNFNKKYLEHLIKIKIDSVRTLHKLKPLINDSILYLAACDQAEYLKIKNTLGHFQDSNATKKTPQLRAEYYGAVNYSVGENVAQNFVNIPVKGKHTKEHINDTYDRTAFDIVDGWVHSPGHYANIITPDYQITGVAISIDNSKNEIRAVQTFAKVAWKYDFVENKEMFDYSTYVPPKLTDSFGEVSHEMHKGKHAWNIIQPKYPDEKLEKTNAAIDSAEGVMNIKIFGKKIVLYTDKVSLMVDLLKKRKDGLAVEIIPYTPYDCGNPAYYEKPSRRNNQCIFSGRVLKPKYRNYLWKCFKPGHIHTLPQIVNGIFKIFFSKGSLNLKKQKIEKLRNNLFNASYFEATLGKIPKDQMGQYIEFNVAVIQNKKLCRILHFTDVCGEDMNMNEKILPSNKITDSTFELHPYKYHYKLSIPFRKNKFDYNYSDLKPFLDSLDKDSITVLQLKIHAQTSIEGAEGINAELQQKRAQSIAEALQKVQKTAIKTEITTGSGWDTFAKQIAKDKHLDALKNKSSAELAKLFEDTATCNKYEVYLAAQRKADISLDIYKNITDANRSWYVRNNYKRCIDSITKFNKLKKYPEKISLYVDTLIKIQSYAYKYVLKGKLDTAMLFKLTLPTGCRYAKLNFERLCMKDKFYRLSSLNKIQYNTELKTISECLPQFQDDSLFNFQVFYSHALLLIDNLKETSVTGISIDKSYDEISTLLTQLALYIKKYPANMDSYKNMYMNFYLNVADCLPPEYMNSKTKSIRDDCLDKIYLHFIMDTLMNDTTALKIARYFIYQGKTNFAFSIIHPYLLLKNPNHQILQLYLKMVYENIEEYPKTQYYTSLIDAAEYLDNKEWCEMFVGPCNISFQAFDYEPLRNLYCKKCSEYVNYAREKK